MRRGYYAAVSQTDDEIGRVLDELEQLGLSNDTLVRTQAQVFSHRLLAWPFAVCKRDSYVFPPALAGCFAL